MFAILFTSSGERRCSLTSRSIGIFRGRTSDKKRTTPVWEPEGARLGVWA